MTPNRIVRLHQLTMKYLFIHLLVLLLVSCDWESFEEKFSKVQIGHSREQVTQLLGDPNMKKDDTVPKGPYFGPQKGLESMIGPGSSYEEWQYKNNKRDYFIWFSTTSAKPKSQWVVVNKADYPEGVVF